MTTVNGSAIRDTLRSLAEPYVTNSYTGAGGQQAATAVGPNGTKVAVAGNPATGNGAAIWTGSAKGRTFVGAAEGTVSDGAASLNTVKAFTTPNGEQGVKNVQTTATNTGSSVAVERNRDQYNSLGQSASIETKLQYDQAAGTLNVERARTFTNASGQAYSFSKSVTFPLNPQISEPKPAEVPATPAPPTAAAPGPAPAAPQPTQTQSSSQPNSVTSSSSTVDGESYATTWTDANGNGKVDDGDVMTTGSTNGQSTVIWVVGSDQATVMWGDTHVAQVKLSEETKKSFMQQVDNANSGKDVDESVFTTAMMGAVNDDSSDGVKSNGWGTVTSEMHIDSDETIEVAPGVTVKLNNEGHSDGGYYTNGVMVSVQNTNNSGVTTSAVVGQNSKLTDSTADSLKAETGLSANSSFGTNPFTDTGSAEVKIASGEFVSTTTGEQLEGYHYKADATVVNAQKASVAALGTADGKVEAYKAPAAPATGTGGGASGTSSLAYAGAVPVPEEEDGDEATSLVSTTASNPAASGTAVA